MIVLVNPITKAPTAFEPPDFANHILDGPYQNVAEVSDEWVRAERDRLGRHILENYEKWSRYPEAIADAVKSEREACARIAEAGVDEEHGASTVSANRRGLMLRIARTIRDRNTAG